MRYVKVEDGKVTKTIDNLGKEYPTTCFPAGGPNSDWLSGEKLVVVTEVKFSDSRDKVENVDPFLDDGKWYTQKVTPYVAPTITTDEKWEMIRNDRNDRLRRCDYIFCDDAPSSVTSKLDDWKTYRQQLRDLPTTNSDPDKIVFPKEPS